MTARPLATLVAAGLSAGLVLAGPAAHADRSVTTDAASDAVSIMFSEAGAEDFTTAPAPEQASVDITRTVVQHRTERVRVSVRYRDLQLGRDVYHFTSLRVLTPAGGYTLDIENLTGRRGAAQLRRGTRPVECRGLRWSQDEDTDKVTASVPTTCLGAPRWVRVGVVAVAVPGDLATAQPEDLQIFADDGHRSGRISEKAIAKGPKVFAG